MTKWSPIGKIAAHSAYDVFSWYKYLIVNLVFFPPRFLEWESFFFLIAPFSDRCLLVLLKLHAGGSGVRLFDVPDIKLFILVG